MTSVREQADGARFEPATIPRQANLDVIVRELQQECDRLDAAPCQPPAGGLLPHKEREARCSASRAGVPAERRPGNHAGCGNPVSGTRTLDGQFEQKGREPISGSLLTCLFFYEFFGCGGVLSSSQLWSQETPNHGPTGET